MAHALHIHCTCTCTLMVVEFCGTLTQCSLIRALWWKHIVHLSSAVARLDSRQIADSIAYSYWSKQGIILHMGLQGIANSITKGIFATPGKVGTLQAVMGG